MNWKANLQGEKTYIEADECQIQLECGFEKVENKSSRQ
jgi:hypothetical protein